MKNLFDEMEVQIIREREKVKREVSYTAQTENNLGDLCSPSTYSMCLYRDISMK